MTYKIAWFPQKTIFYPFQFLPASCVLVLLGQNQKTQLPFVTWKVHRKGGIRKCLRRCNKGLCDCFGHITDDKVKWVKIHRFSKEALRERWKFQTWWSHPAVRGVVSTAPPYRGAGEDQERVGGRRQGRQVGGRSASALLPAAEQFPGRSDSSRKLATLGLRGSLHCCFSSANSKGSGQRGRHRGKVFLTSVKSHTPFQFVIWIFLHPFFKFRDGLDSQ